MTQPTLLIVEDDGILAANLEAIIRGLGYGVLGPVASGEAALALLENQSADLVLMDIELAGALNGIETATIITNRCDLPIVFLTGYSQDPLLEQAKSAMPYGYLIKPVPERELAATVAMSLHRHRLDCQLRASRTDLARSEARYRHLFEDSPLGIFRSTMDGRLLLVNGEMARMLGYASPEEALHHVTDLGQQLYVDPGRRLDFLDLLRTQGEVRDFTFQGWKKNSGCLWISLNARLSANDNLAQEDEPTIEGFAQDITARAKAEAALQESLEHHRHYLRSTPYGVFAVDQQGRYLQVNPAACQITGYSEGELLTMSISDLLFPADQEAGRQHFQSVRREGKAHGELPFRTRTGERRWWAVTAVKAAEGRYLGFCNDITEQRRAEIGLRESETNFRTIFTSLTDMLLVAELDGRILAANEILCHTLGYSETELTAMRVLDLYPADKARETENILAAMLREERTECHLPLRTKNGDLVPTISRIWRGNWNGRPCLFGSSRDLSAEQEAEQRFEQMFRHNPALMALSAVDDQTFLDVNEAWLATTGYSRDEVLGHAPLALGLFASPEQYNRAEEQLRLKGRIVDIELQIRCKNGTMRQGLFSGETIHSKGHQALLTVMIDITERKQAEEALERRIIALVQPLDSPEGITIEELFNLDDLQRLQDEFAEATGVASIITRTDGTPITRPSNFCRLCAEIIRASPAGQANCFRSDAQIGRACVDGPTIQPCLSGGLWDAGAGITVGGRHIANWLIGQVRDQAYSEEKMRAYAREIGVDEQAALAALAEVPTMTRAQFERIARVLFTLASQLSAVAYQNIQQARFITERKQAEEEKKWLQAQLFQAQKLEAIGTLAGGIAHDFNNILSAILGYADLSREDVPDGSILARNLDQILKAGNRAKDLIKQILAFSRQAATEAVVLYPAVIVKEAIKMLRPSLPATIAIDHRIDESAGPVQIDPSQFHQVVINLCTNAFQAMEQDGGRLDIAVRAAHFDAHRLAGHPQAQPGPYVELLVGDSGPGIDETTLPRIFDPFFTTKEVGKGTGMGLAIVHGIIKASGGFITIDSRPGQGTIFQVCLPVATRATAIETIPAPPLPRGSEHILLVDDEEALAIMIQTGLERMGYRVTVHTSSPKALVAFENQPEHFDLVITDQTMPGLTGMELAARMLRIRPETPIILCTGYSSLVSEQMATALGIKGFALKPVTKNDLVQLIRRALAPT